MATYVTKTHLENFTEKLLTNDKKIRDELKQEISNLPSGGGSGSSYTLPTASTTTLGGVKVDGTTVTINPDGVISATSSGSGSYTLPKATDTTLGGVKVDNDTITVDGEGVISSKQYTLPTASDSTLGGVKVDGTTITIDDNGVITSHQSSSEIEEKKQFTLEQGAFTVKGSLTTSTTRVRTNELTFTEKALIKVNYDDTQFDIIYLQNPKPVNYDMTWLSKHVFCCDSGKIRFGFRKKDNTSTITPEELSDVTYSIITTKKERKTPSTIIIATNKSSDEDMLLADYVCDGSNDQVEIQQAIIELENTSGEIILCNGNYYVDALTPVTRGATTMHLGIYMTNPKFTHSLKIRGMCKPSRIGKHQITGTAIINLCSNAYSSLTDADSIKVFGALPGQDNKMERVYPCLNMSFENLGINLATNLYSIMAIDGYLLSNMRVDYVFVGILDVGGTLSATPNEKCVGIRTLDGYNFGTGYYINHTFVWGMGVAYWIGGEHLIMQEAGCRQCDLSYKFNGFGNNTTKASHPQTLINCCEEQCKRSMYFCKNDKKQAINIIDYNTEERTYEFSDTYNRATKAVEERPGDYIGTITFAANYENYINNGAIRFWEGNSGKNFKTVNLAHKLSGTTDERPEAPNLNQQYFDTTLNKMICFIGGKWVDYSGVQVDDRRYTITNNLTGCSSSNSVIDVDERKSYKTTITADSGNTLTKVEYTMSGAKYKVTDGVINIPYVTGNIVITATAESI